MTDDFKAFRLNRWKILAGYLGIFMGKMSVRWLIGAVVVAAFGVMLWLATRPPPLTIQGEVTADRVDISPRVASRIVTLKADVGDTEQRGAGMGELGRRGIGAPRLARPVAVPVGMGGSDTTD